MYYAAESFNVIINETHSHRNGSDVISRHFLRRQIDPCLDNGGGRGAKTPQRPSYQIKRLDNGANFGSLPSRQYRQKARKARRDVLSSMGKFPPVRRRWILFLRASYFRSRYNKVPPFDKTSSHEFPATCRGRQHRGVASSGARKKAPFTESAKSTGDIWSRRGKRSKIFPYARKLRAAGRVGLSSFPRDDWNI